MNIVVGTRAKLVIQLAAIAMAKQLIPAGRKASSFRTSLEGPLSASCWLGHSGRFVVDFREVLKRRRLQTRARGYSASTAPTKAMVLKLTLVAGRLDQLSIQ
jgi:hypothetical protein